MHELRRDLEQLKNSAKAKLLRGFFKTGHGEYGEGDIFLGITVPVCRELAKKYEDVSFSEIKQLLSSKIHEERLIALLILIENFTKSTEAEKKRIYDFYLSSRARINNWDLVDLSSHKIVGAYLFNKPKTILRKLACSKNVWERRIAIISTFYFIKNNSFDETLSIAKMLLNDTHDLIHKAVGWALREVGKKAMDKEKKFLDVYASKMPRTTLRYAIERMTEAEKKHYLNETSTVRLKRRKRVL